MVLALDLSRILRACSSAKLALDTSSHVIPLDRMGLGLLFSEEEEHEQEEDGHEKEEEGHEQEQGRCDHERGPEGQRARGLEEEPVAGAFLDGWIKQRVEVLMRGSF